MAGDGPMRAALEARVAAGAPRAGRVPGRRLRPASRAARLVLAVPAAGAGGRVLDHGAGGVRRRLAGGGAARRSAPIARASTGRTWSWPRTTAPRRSPTPSSRPCSATSASASRAGAPSPTRSTGSGSAGGSSTSSSASPERRPSARPAPASRGVTWMRRRAEDSATGRWKVVLLALSALLAGRGSLAREALDGPTLGERALGGGGGDPAQLPSSCRSRRRAGGWPWSSRRRSARCWPRPSRGCWPTPPSGSAAAIWSARRACARGSERAARRRLRVHLGRARRRGAGARHPDLRHRAR